MCIKYVPLKTPLIDDVASFNFFVKIFFFLSQYFLLTKEVINVRKKK